jgi:hypothetical protein
MLRVNGCGQRLRTAGRSLQHEKILRRANIDKKLADSACDRSKRRRFFRNSIKRTISFRGFYQLQLAKIPRERRLRDS